MADKRKKRPLVREDEPSQETPKGLKIPLPAREEVLNNLKRIAKAPSRTKGSSKQ